MAYEPEVFNPLLTGEEETVENLVEHIHRELTKIAEELKFLHMLAHHEEPKRVYTGLTVLADGTDWNPGSGRGIYWYDGGTSSWKFLG